MKSHMQNLHMRDMKATTVSKRHLRKQIYNFGFVKQSYYSTFIHFILLPTEKLNIMTTDMERPKKHHMRLTVRFLNKFQPSSPHYALPWPLTNDLACCLPAFILLIVCFHPVYPPRTRRLGQLMGQLWSWRQSPSSQTGKGCIQGASIRKILNGLW